MVDERLELGLEEVPADILVLWDTSVVGETLELYADEAVAVILVL